MRKVLTMVMAFALLGPTLPSLAQALTPKPAKSWDLIAGNWKRLKGSVKRQWGRLTSNDIAEANGQRDILAGKIQVRYGIDKAKADAEIDAWLKAQR